MSYQVLARKCRPRHFNSMVGQEHVLRSLTNALNNQRLHHAYLFTGTRGVGKTTIARILVKCLNCETGITSTPCGICSACQEIDAGRFIDLIEVDAASRTKVEDTRELLENVQYAPSRGRYKIYLIDEVHMLSGHSFNALLKTLEEPPEHVKFLLATTDPQKLPVTILSRCLQFNLKALPINRIDQYLQQLLQEEKISFEPQATYHIAKAANGSMRDALSLLDQAIAFTEANISSREVSLMLGTIEQTYIEELMNALLQQNGKELLAISERLAEMSADFNYVLEELISYLHYIAIAQIVPEAANNRNKKIITELSQSISSEDLQLFYQIALMGRRDLALATDPRQSFEMTLLRMLAFIPVTENAPQQAIPSPAPKTETQKSGKAAPPVNQPQQQPVDTNTMESIINWSELLPKLNLNGMLYALASNCALKKASFNQIELIISSQYAALVNKKLIERLTHVLNEHFHRKIRLSIAVEEIKSETPAQQEQRIASDEHQRAIDTIKNDPHVQEILDQLGACIEPNLVKAT